MIRPSIFGDRFMTDIFDDMWPYSRTMVKDEGAAMKTDVKDLGDKYQLMMDLPGFGKENIQAQLKDGYLTVTAEKSSDNEEKDEEGKFVRRERYSGKYQRSFYVGKHVELEDMTAEFKDGVLNIVFPKEEAKPKIEEQKFIEIH
ncbi:MAG: Hsp20/alpha crystallin family protein [Lachnospiraceae bacterium]|nr:Hsp20/alpha crystallin family protein [Lachnospiraceae bacterium]